MRIVDTTCTKCGANLHIDADRKIAFCEYCGAQLLIDDEVQHLQIDNAESAGYAFEKGRQRAQNEAQAQRYYYNQPQPAPKKKRRNMFWWVVGWIFMFPIPLTIIVSRNKKLKTGAKIGVIAAAWIIYLLIGISANASKDNKQAASIKTHTSYTEMTSGGAK